ncbi:MAG: circadian clock KaiB family protein [Bacteroidales bacterium]|nr:circadian clock KaiB family protein [Bacteroidales bacterium]
MKKTKLKIKETPGKVEQLMPEQHQRKYILRLYITGTTNRSIMAITNLKKICEEYLEGQYDLEVIDLYKNPNLAEGDQIIASPTLIKKLPLPFRRIIGDMSNTENVLLGLDIREVKKS